MKIFVKGGDMAWMSVPHASGTAGAGCPLAASAAAGLHQLPHLARFRSLVSPVTSHSYSFCRFHRRNWPWQALANSSDSANSVKPPSHHQRHLSRRRARAGGTAALAQDAQQVPQSQGVTCMGATEGGTRPIFDYSALLRRANEGGAGACPALFLAPMENLMDRPARLALNFAVGGFDEACTEFMRVPPHSEHTAACVRGVTARYNAAELGDIPLGAQLMGSNAELLAAAAARLVHVKGAPRVDLNCGAPPACCTYFCGRSLPCSTQLTTESSAGRRGTQVSCKHATPHTVTHDSQAVPPTSSLGVVQAQGVARNIPLSTPPPLLPYPLGVHVWCMQYDECLHVLLWFNAQQ